MIIRGIILREHSNNPIPFVQVKLDNLATKVDENITTNADGKGYFYFNVPDGEYQLRIRHQFYQPYSENVYTSINRTIYLRKIIL